ncbi:fungal-specific transcription factor domain-containing protein [Chaetomidium leptoderma]|uniref:Fungal-specific transcription factor domain-containing protein n=1 Tax=Chaetomidium leptoderma TaxID=669021 RepID=A0AAN6ZWA3_9PEZI|nr:fungal-specific transcription factor domain-containing protein [Chaetomidium leptoderma]
MDSDDAPSVGLPSPWLDSLTTCSTSVSVSSSTMGFTSTGQLSPISNGVDLPYGAARSSASLASPSLSPPVTAESHSAPSPVRAQAWDPGYTSAEHIAVLPSGHDSYAAHHQDVAWEDVSNDILTVPKLEPLDDDDFCMDDLEDAPSPPVLTFESHSQGAPGQPKHKRPRGRPRKHPLLPNASANKITKGRSKTGCLTCRKRKKKCDEAKPRCMNCEKNAVVCEGYPEKQIWKSGKERAEEELIKSRSLPSITMHPLFHGLETVEDRIFWKHYNEQLSAVLTVGGEHKNAFKDMMVPVAVKHQGLMHSILSLASKHIDFETPYGINVLKNNTNTSIEALRERSLYHHDQARLKFYHDVEFTNGKPNADDSTLVAARYGQMLCFFLEALVEGSPRGEHRLHLTVYRNLVSTSPPEDSAFLSFIAEVFQYHILADQLIHSAISQDAACSPVKSLPPIPAIYPPRLLGVADGLLGHLSQITAIRNTVRSKMMAQIDPVVDYADLYSAADIDAAIRDWTPYWPPGDNRDRVSLLYKQMMWIYLDRTIYPPSPLVPSFAPSSVLPLSVIHNSLSHDRPAAAPLVVNTPPQSVSTSCASSPKCAGPNPQSDSSTRGAHGGGGNTGTGGDDDAATAAGARNRAADDDYHHPPLPPARHPPHLDPRVTVAVDESLAVLESFKPGDPCQTLLLLPCFLVGTACFGHAQRKRVRAAVRTVRAYTGLRHADRAAEVLEEVWRLMEAGDWVGAWDWPGVADRLGLDFIPA